MKTDVLVNRKYVTKPPFFSDNLWGIPSLPAFPPEQLPQQLISYRERRTVKGDLATHFFLSDYRFEGVWTYPDRSLSALQTKTLTPDFSLWREMPLAEQQWNVYRNRWCGAFWASQGGHSVIPTASWSTPESYNFCFAGIAKYSVVAISTVGQQRHERPLDRELFLAGYAELLRQIDPVVVICHGRVPNSLKEDSRIIEFLPMEVNHGG